MSIAAKLLAAQSRPPAEAERITHAMAAAADDDASAAEQIAAAEAAANTANYIADEKSPPRGAPPPGHTAEFVDGELDAPMFDDAPEPEAGHRSDPRYLLDAEPDPTPEPAPRPLTPWERDAAAATAAVPAPEPAPQPEPEPEPEPRRQPLRERFSMHPLKLAGAGIGGIALATVIALSFMGGGRGKPPEPAGQVAAPPTAVDNTPTPQTDAPLIPATVSASCGNHSDAVAPFSGDRTRAWVCQRIHGLDLNVLNIQFAQPVVINAICVVPGFNYVAPDGRDEWARHRLVTAVTWRMGGASYDQQLTPTRTGVCQEFPSVITQEMSMTTTASMRPPLDENQNSGQFGGSGDGDDPAKIDETTAISEIVITGHPVDPGAAAAPGGPA